MPASGAVREAVSVAEKVRMVARGIRYRIGSVETLRGVDFEVAAGDILGLVGPKGAGKTTLLRVVAGILEPTAGQFEIPGACPDESENQRPRRIAYLGSHEGVYEHA